MTALYEEHYGRRSIPARRTPRSAVLRWAQRRARQATGSYTDEILEKADGVVLDFGCGSGSLLAELVDAGKHAVGFEADEVAAQQCRREGIPVFSPPWESLTEYSTHFDTVVLSQVLEHVHEPVLTLRTLLAVTKPGGHIYIYVPNARSLWRSAFGRFWHGWHLPYHLHHFTEESLRTVLTAGGFEVTHVRTLTPAGGIVVSLQGLLRGRPSADREFSTKRRSILESAPCLLLLGLAAWCLERLRPGRGDCLAVEARRP